MKNMKNKVLAVMMLFIACCLFSACGGASTFTIEGKWKCVGDESYGQVTPGSIVIFDGTHCNFYSPMDTYAFYREDGKNILELTGLLGGNDTFTVEVTNNDSIRVFTNRHTIELKRVQ